MKTNLINYNKTKKIISVILLGGKSSRMNYNKAFLSLPCNSSFLEFIVSKVIPFSYKVVLNFNQETFYLYENKYKDFKNRYEIYFDKNILIEIFDDNDLSYRGPLLGLYSTSKYLFNYFNNEIKCKENYKILLLAIDQVLIQDNLLSFVINGNFLFNYDFIFFKHLNNIYFLPGFYKLNSFEYIEKYINKGNNNKKVSLKNFVNYLLNECYLETKIINTDVIDKEGLTFFRVNTQEDYNLLNSLFIR
jgi:molybdopterin-guanine dinucleotide biosynthesis protein A